MTEGFDRLRQIELTRADNPLVFSPNPAFDDYLKMPKAIAAPEAVPELIQIAESLEKDAIPQYLVAAGSAYYEAALTQDQASTTDRMHLLDRAETSWTRALEIQLGHIESSPWTVDVADPYRTALDLARLPLMRGLVAGDITQNIRQDVRQETLAIAAANNVRGKLAHIEGDSETACSHVGFGHELNFLIAMDSLETPSYISTASLARSGSGHYHPNHTHDLMLIQQRWGRVIDIVPVEIKAKAGRTARNRYSALLIRGKMHLTYNVGYHEPETMRRAFAAVHVGTPTKEEARATRGIRANLLEMIHLYKSGEVLGNVATGKSLLRFRNPAALHDKHPEIAGDLILSA